VPKSHLTVELLVDLGYKSHWSVVPETASELFGLEKNLASCTVSSVLPILLSHLSSQTWLLEHSMGFAWNCLCDHIYVALVKIATDCV
jgi:hypothetical protein